MIITMKLRRCGQHWGFRPLAAFIGHRGKPVNWCNWCREKYRGWEKKTPRERLAAKAKSIRTGDGLRARLFRDSGNKKLGGIPASFTDMMTCPPGCAFKDAGCFAEFSFMRKHWQNVGTNEDNTWRAFCADVATLAAGTLWRHNQAGDLPGRGDRLDLEAFRRLVRSNAKAGARGFTFTHKPLRDPDERRAIMQANAEGFTVNLSADGMLDADRLADLDIGPVAVVVAPDYPARGGLTPAGRRVVTCPAQVHEAITCASCQLCAKPQRRSIVGFRAHGQASELVALRLRGR